MKDAIPQYRKSLRGTPVGSTWFTPYEIRPGTRIAAQVRVTADRTDQRIPMVEVEGTAPGASDYCKDAYGSRTLTDLYANAESCATHIRLSRKKKQNA